MTPNTHRLAAILFADIVGYSRLMGEDQADTLVLLARFREIVEDHIAREDGRVVEHIGDQVFASFDSAQAAVKAGLGLQNALAEFNAAEAGRAEDRRLQSRVGIHLGEVVEKDGDLFGDGVNVAARLESMAPPDWLCISGVVRDQLTDTSGITLIPLGRQPLKNIRHKVNVFLAAPAGLSATARWRAHYQYRFGRRWGRPLGMALGGGALASALVAGILVLRSQPAEAHYLAVSDFRNLAEEGDRGDYFSVGVTEAIRAQLASIPTLYLVDRKQDIGARLRLEGSVQRSAEQVRIVFRLTSKDGETVGGGTVDGSMKEVFALQDRVTRSIATLVAEQYSLNPADLPAPVFTGDITAYDYYLQARDYLRRPHTTENLDNATQLFERALSRDERFARAEAGLCEALWWKYDLTRDTNPADAAEQACRRALALSEKLPEVYVALGNIYQGTGRLDDSVNAYRRAIELDPKNDAAFRGLAFAFEQAGNAGQAEATYRHAIDLQPGYWRGHFWLANFLVGHGRFSEALGSYRQAINLTPDNLQVYENLGGVLFFTGRFEEAIQALEKALELRPTARAYSNLGTVYYYAGRFTDSRDQFLRALELAPDDYRWWHNLGDVYRQLGNSKSAESYTRALQLGRKRLDINPQDGFAWKVLSLVLARLGQEEEARRALESAMKYSPNDVDLDFQRALVFEALGEREAALEALEKAIRGGQSAAIVRGDPDIADLIRSPRIRELISESE